MSALCSFCVHHVAVNGEAVNSNIFFDSSRGKRTFFVDNFFAVVYNVQVGDAGAWGIKCKMRRSSCDRIL